MDFLILLSIARWYIFWCHTDTWFSFKENEDNLSFCLVKLKLAFKNTIFWCWIRALIDTSHFVICHWLNVKHTVHQNIFQYHSAIWDGFFKKYPKPTILDKTVETKWKIYFSVKKPLFSQNNVVCKVLGFWQQKLDIFNI